MVENKKFGKGLSSLLGDRKLSIIDSKSEIDIDEIITNKKQPRKFFNDESINELVQSVKQYGILQPIIVRKIGNSYEIIAGERRYRAAKLAGLKTMPVIIRNYDEKDSFSISIIENIQRENLNLVEEATAYRELIDNYNYTQQDISNIVNKSRSHIGNLLRLLTLPENILNYLKDGKIEMGHARALIGYPYAERIVDSIIENNMTVREVENLVKNRLSLVSKELSKGIKIPINISNKIKELSEKINAKCEIKYNRKNEMLIMTVNFNSLEELDNFINKF